MRSGRPESKTGTDSPTGQRPRTCLYPLSLCGVLLFAYAWYKNGFAPEQPGLKHDFLPKVVKLGHQEGMLVMGYFCIASNPKWAEEHPDLSYGTPTTYHIPYTDEYLEYLSKSIQDAVRKTGVDGFMIDWLSQHRHTRGQAAAGTSGKTASTPAGWTTCTSGRR